MNKIAEMITNGEITVEELAEAKELIDRSDLVVQALEACKKTILFPLGSTEIHCYNYEDGLGEYHAWGYCKNNGDLSLFCNWGGDHLIGNRDVNLLDFNEVFLALEDEELKNELERFLKQQLKKIQ